MTAADDASSVLRTMFEIHRMLGQDNKLELERLAGTNRRAAKPRAPQRAELRARRLPLVVPLAVTELKALAGTSIG